MLKNLRMAISSIKVDDRIRSLIFLFFIFIFIVIIATILYDILPLTIAYSLWGQDSFYAGLVTNMHSSAIDFLFFSIVLYIIMTKHEKHGKIKQYQENIDDTRFWMSEEAAFKNYANIRRLQELGINSIDISKCTLSYTKSKNLNFSNSKIMGAILDFANFEGSKFSQTSFRGAFAISTSFNNVKIIECSMDYIKLKNGKMRSSYLDDVSFEKAELDDTDFHSTVFTNCNFKNSSLQGCNMERTDLRKSRELTIEQLLSCKSLKYARLDEELEIEIRAIRPELLGKAPQKPAHLRKALPPSR